MTRTKRGRMLAVSGDWVAAEESTGKDQSMMGMLAAALGMVALALVVLDAALGLVA